MRYKKTKAFWDDVFTDYDKSPPADGRLSIKAVDDALDMLAETADETFRVVDFGCAPGVMLFCLTKRREGVYFGVDISEEGIKRSKELFKGERPFPRFLLGSLEKLSVFKDEEADAFILSNIIDNLAPADTRDLLSEAHRILKPCGRILVKLNPYLSPADIAHEGLVPTDDEVDFYKGSDGLYLWNLDTGAWSAIFDSYGFSVAKQEELGEKAGKNRLFILERRDE